MSSGPYRAGHGGSDPEWGNNENFTGFTDPEVRRNFVKKVYFILTIQLGITAVIILPFQTTHKVQEFAHDHSYLMFVALIGFMVTQIALVCCEGVRRAFPCNLIVLTVMTLCMAVMCGFITTRYSTEVVLLAFLMTAVVCLLVSLVAWFAPIDITGCGMLMCILGLAFSIFGIVCMVCVAYFKLNFIMLIYSGIAVALFSLYLMFDTQQIMGGKRVELSPEEYVLGALQLYIDIIEIFINLLPLIAACFSDE